MDDYVVVDVIEEEALESACPEVVGRGVEKTVALAGEVVERVVHQSHGGCRCRRLACFSEVIVFVAEVFKDLQEV